MRTSRHFNCLPKVAKMVCRVSKHDAVFLLPVYTRLTNYVSDQEGFILTIDFSSDIAQAETIKLYKLLNTAEKLKYNHRKKSFNWRN